MRTPPTGDVGGGGAETKTADRAAVTLPRPGDIPLIYHKAGRHFEVRIPPELAGIDAGIKCWLPEIRHPHIRLFDAWGFAELVARAKQRGVPAQLQARGSV